MATELNKSIVVDTNTYDDYAIGITLPLRFVNNTFEQSYQTIDQLKSNIKNLLLTNKGERIMQPEFGSGLQSLVFEQLDTDLEEQIESTIIQAMNMWLPFVSVDNIQVDMSNTLKDRNMVSISLQFTVGDNVDLNEVSFTIQQ
jgi:uncharacterized protein